jgi:hypothetical protein
VGNPSTETTVPEGHCLKGRIYHAHAICTYGRPAEQHEQALIRLVFPEYEIVDPGLAKENEEKLLGGMDYCKKLVESCDALAFSRILGRVNAGVGVEVGHALALGNQSTSSLVMALGRSSNHRHVFRGKRLGNSMSNG